MDGATLATSDLKGMRYMGGTNMPLVVDPVLTPDTLYSEGFTSDDDLESHHTPPTTNTNINTANNNTALRIPSVLSDDKSSMELVSLEKNNNKPGPSSLTDIVSTGDDDDHHLNENHDHDTEHHHKLPLTLQSVPAKNKPSTMVNTNNANEGNDTSPRSRKKGVFSYLKRRYLGFEQHLLRRSNFKRDNQFRSQLELITAIDDHCDHVIHSYSSFRLFILAITGGVYISIGILFAMLVSTDIPYGALQKFMVGIAFVGCFTMIIFSKSILFTEVNISVPIHMFKNDIIGMTRRSFLKLFRACTSCFTSHLDEIVIQRPRRNVRLITILHSFKLWGICIVGNVTGSILMSTILNCSLSYNENGSVINTFAKALYHKVIPFKELGALGWFSCVLSGTMANFMIGTATLLATQPTTVVGKIVALAFPILAFASLGVQHAPANVGYFSQILVWKGIFGQHSGHEITPMSPELKYLLDELYWPDVISWNLIPAAIGNAISGIVLSFLFVYIFIK
ncbi:hypothetical protein ABK040_000194 [Willaertia magna]